MSDTNAEGSDPSFRHIPFKDRWECLRPTIKRLYMEEGKNLADVAKIMKDNYFFDASESQYKTRFRSWGMKRSITKEKKEAILKKVDARGRVGKVSAPRVKGKEVEKKLQRYVRTKALNIRKEDMGPPLNFDAMLFKPRTPLTFSDSVSTLGTSPGVVSTPSDTSMSPGDATNTAASPLNRSSLPTTLVRKNLDIERALRTRLFIEGSYDELFAKLSQSERRTINTWLDHFQLFIFKTAKHWGRGPRSWSWDLINFRRSHIVGATPTVASPIQFPLGQHQSVSLPSSSPNSETFTPRGILPPSDLCNWSIHVEDVYYEEIPESPPSEPEDMDLSDETRWPPWSDIPHPSFTQTLQEALSQNSFSDIRSDDMPIEPSQLVKAAKRSEEEFLLDAFKSSIMSSNIELCQSLLDELGDKGVDSTTVYPLHIATTYLNGAQQCCNIILFLVRRCYRRRLKLHSNPQGHTVLDNLWMSVLRAHTTCSPVVVDDTLKSQAQFLGGEVDICGRWDLDSDCIQDLRSQGLPIPHRWKHPFCHTSAQAVSHTIGLLLRAFIKDRISGLFLKYCQNCGLKLQFKELHTLILVAFHVANSGCKGESLLGMLACLLQYLEGGVDPKVSAHISLAALLGRDNPEECSHRDLDAVQFFNEIPESLMAHWNNKVRTGWELMRFVLVYSSKNGTRRSCSGEICEPHIRQSRQSSPENGDNESLQAEISRASIDRIYEPLDNFFEDENYSFLTMADSNFHQPSGDDTDMMSASGNQSTYSDSAEYLHPDIRSEPYLDEKGLLATLNAAIKTELLTYRRISEGDPWVSPNFDMANLLHGLVSENMVDVKLVQNRMMKPFCHCGNFALGSEDLGNPTADRACSHYFANLEDWKRSSFIPTRSYYEE